MRTNTALAVRPVMPPADPVFAAIERFHDAAEAYWTAHEAAAKRLGRSLWGSHPALAAFADAWQRAGAELAGTPATTLAGIAALAEPIASDCEVIEIDIGEGAEALRLAGNLRDSIAALAENAATTEERR